MTLISTKKAWDDEVSFWNNLTLWRIDSLLVPYTAKAIVFKRSRENFSISYLPVDGCGLRPLFLRNVRTFPLHPRKRNSMPQYRPKKEDGGISHTRFCEVYHASGNSKLEVLRLNDSMEVFSRWTWELTELRDKFIANNRENASLASRPRTEFLKTIEFKNLLFCLRYSLLCLINEPVYHFTCKSTNLIFWSTKFTTLLTLFTI